MIKVQLNIHNFEYDIHSLVKAFYPQEEVRISYEGEKVPEKKNTPEEESLQILTLVISFVLGEDADKTDDIRFVRMDIMQAEDLKKSASLAFKENSSRAENKNELKRLIYRTLSEFTGRKLPWGDLTGIRPTKIPMAYLQAGESEEEISRFMQENYYTSPEKTRLAIDIARREQKILNGIDYKNGYSLYVGIPFCPSICLYCSFSSSPLHLWKDKVDDYLDALCHEIDESAGLLSDKKLNTIYIGGGTPTTLEPSQMDRLLSKIEERFPASSVSEFTVEAGRPDTITRDKLKVLRDHKISRISINPQTMNQDTLDFIGRHHTVEQIKDCFRMARELGFDNINMDLIVGLPGEELPQVENTLKELSLLKPDNVTVHSLAVKRAARLRLFSQEHKEMTMVNNQAIMEMTGSYCADMGMTPYYLYRQKNMAGNFENVGYAKENMAGIYNILIMEEVQSILALGAGASTKMVYASDRIERIENVKDIRQYIDRIDEMINRKRTGIIGNK